MDTVTYPDPEVQRELRASFTGLGIDLLARHPDLKEVSGAQRIMFAPTFVFRDKGRELRRFTGWLPPRAFRAEILLVRALAAQQRGDFAAARGLCEEVGARFPDTPAAPEALYWQGIAGFLAGGKDLAALRVAWEELARAHPQSRFGIHASVIADAR